MGRHQPRQPRGAALAEVDVATGAVTERLPERKLSSYRVARDGSFVVLQEDMTAKTDYDTIGGTDNRLQVVDARRRRAADALCAEGLQGPDAAVERGLAVVRVREAGRSVRSAASTGGEARSVTPKPPSTERRRRDKPAAPAVVTPDEKKETETAESFIVDSFSRDGSKLLVTSRKGWYVVNVADATRAQILHARRRRGEEPARRGARLDARTARASTRPGARATSWERGVVRIDVATGQMTTHRAGRAALQRRAAVA